jgi:hypothetical protein
MLNGCGGSGALLVSLPHTCWLTGMPPTVGAQRALPADVMHVIDHSAQLLMVMERVGA